MAAKRESQVELPAAVAAAIRSRVQVEEGVWLSQSRLISEPCVESSVLVQACRRLQPQQFEDVVVERCLHQKCGFPCCKSQLSESRCRRCVYAFVLHVPMPCLHYFLCCLSPRFYS